MDVEEFRNRIRAAFPDAEVEVRDLTGCGDHFEAVVATSAFRGKGRVEQHRMVYAALAKREGGNSFRKPCASVRTEADDAKDWGDAIHALALTTRVK